MPGTEAIVALIERYHPGRSAHQIAAATGDQVSYMTIVNIRNGVTKRVQARTLDLLHEGLNIPRDELYEAAGRPLTDAVPLPPMVGRLDRARQAALYRYAVRLLAEQVIADLDAENGGPDQP